MFHGCSLIINGCLYGHLIILLTSMEEKSNFNKTMNMVLLRRICQHGQPGRCLSVEDIHSHLSRKSPRVSNRGLKGLFQEVPQYFMIDYGTFGTPNMHFRILTEFLTEFIQFRNAPLQPSCCTNITSAVLLGHHLQNNTSMVLEKRKWAGRKLSDGRVHHMQHFDQEEL